MFTRIRLPAQSSLDSWARLAVCSRAEGKRISPSCPRFILRTEDDGAGSWDEALNRGKLWPIIVLTI